MTNKAYVRDALYCDIGSIAGDMRSADVAEIKAAANASPAQALELGMLGEVTKTVCLPNGLPVAMYGINPLPYSDRVGVVWMLAGEGIKHCQTQFARESKQRIDELTRGYSLVFNVSDVRNTLHHRWLKWCGFTFIKEHPEYGSGGLPFYEFCKITEAH